MVEACGIWEHLYSGGLQIIELCKSQLGSPSFLCKIMIPIILFLYDHLHRNYLQDNDNEGLCENKSCLIRVIWAAVPSSGPPPPAPLGTPLTDFFKCL